MKYKLVRPVGQYKYSYWVGFKFIATEVTPPVAFNVEITAYIAKHARRYAKSAYTCSGELLFHQNVGYGPKLKFFSAIPRNRNESLHYFAQWFRYGRGEVVQLRLLCKSRRNEVGKFSKSGNVGARHKTNAFK